MQRLAYIFVALLIWPLLLLVSARMIWAAITNPARARIIALSLDDLANVATNGYFRTTISLRAAQAQAERKKWGCVMCNILDYLIEKGHCAKALLRSRE